jgi:hypothetical protein
MTSYKHRLVITTEVYEGFVCLFICLMVLNATFNNISVISWRLVLLVEETGGSGENHRPVASHWQTLSHNVLHLALSGVWSIVNILLLCVHSKLAFSIVLLLSWCLIWPHKGLSLWPTYVGPSSPISYGSWIIYAIGAYHHWCCEFDSRSGRGVKHYVIKFVSDLRQVGGFLRILRFPPPIKLTATI